MTFVKRFLIILRFMTTIPVKADIMAAREDYGKSLAAAPLVGLVIGLLIAGLHFVLGLVFPPAITAVLTFLAYILLTGGLHLDGLGDTADGLFSNRPKDRMLEIMKDSRVGTYAVITLIMIILLDVLFIAALKRNAAIVLILMPVAGRTGSLIGSGASSYAGISDGPGRWCVEYCKGVDIAKGLMIQVLIFITFIATGIFNTGLLQPRFIIAGVIVTAIPPLSAFILTKLLGRKLGGVTGDILGAVCELNQVIFLMSSFILIRVL